jgi:hypothetical protein
MPLSTTFGVEFDASVIEETGKSVPMVQGVANGFGDHGLLGNAIDAAAMRAYGPIRPNTSLKVLVSSGFVVKVLG